MGASERTSTMKREIIILSLIIALSLLGTLLNNVTFIDYGAYLWVVPTASALLGIATLLATAIWKATTRPIRYASRFFMVLAIVQLPMLLLGRLPYTLMHPRLGEWQQLRNEARIAESNSDWNSAESLYRRLAKAEADGWVEHSIYNRSQFNLADALAKQNKLAEAEKEYLVGIANVEQLEGLQSPFLVSPLFELAQIYENQKRYDEAIKTFGRAVEISDKSPGAASTTISLYESFSKTLDQAGRSQEAKSFADRALKLRREIESPAQN